MPISSNNQLEQDRHSLDKTEQLVEYVDALVTTNEQQQESDAELTRLLDQKFKQLTSDIEQQLGGFFGEFEARFEQLREWVTETENPKVAATNELASKKTDGQAAIGTGGTSIESEWERQKRKLLEEHGYPVAETSASNEPSRPEKDEDHRETPRAGIKDEDAKLESLHDSIQNIDTIDSEEIEELKTELTSKLRDAEVELSINRAKLSQQWAALEQKQFEITQRESTLRSKYGDIETSGRKPRLLDRLSRHLSKKPPDYSDDEST